MGNGLSALQATVMSLLVFTGVSQFAAFGVVAAGGSALTAVTSGLLLGVRNAAYGLAVEDTLPKRLWARVLIAHLIIDEAVALCSRARLTAPSEPGRGVPLTLT